MNDGNSTHPGSLKPIGGWLLFFAVWHALIIPAGTWIKYCRMQAGLQNLLATRPELQGQVKLTLVSGVLFAIAASVSGWIVLVGSRHGRTVARFYLKWRMVLVFVLSTATTITTWRVAPDLLRNELFWMPKISWVGRELIIFVIWWSYFAKSRRVQETYGP